MGSVARMPWGAVTLALVAGWVNAVGLLGFEHQSISHLSGLATLLGAAGAQGQGAQGLHLLAIVICFWLGAVVSGARLAATNEQRGPLLLQGCDTILLAFEALLFAASYWILAEGSAIGHYTASAACGLQNAMTTQLSRGQIRSTHVTGLFTDLGLMLGARMRGVRLHGGRVAAFALLIIGFIAGGGLGAIMFNLLHYGALLVPAGLCAALAVFSRFWR